MGRPTCFESRLHQFSPALFRDRPSLFSLLGLTLFLKFSKTRPFVAGASSRLLFAVLWGVAASLVASPYGLSVPYPRTRGWYFTMMPVAPIPDRFVSCFSTVLRVAISRVCRVDGMVSVGGKLSLAANGAGAA